MATGKEQQNHRLANRLLTICLVAMVLILSACNGGTSTLQTTTPPQTTATPTTTTTPPHTTPMSELSVHFIDVGQGDATLVDLGETEILIDGGGKSPGVVSYLNDYIDGKFYVNICDWPPMGSHGQMTLTKHEVPLINDTLHYPDGYNI